MESVATDRFNDYSRQWGLAPDGAPIRTPIGALSPVRQNGVPLMLKIAAAQEEQAGGALLAWWNGDGAARVFARDGDALLMERATGERSLAAMAARGKDDEACRIICRVVARLHRPRETPTPTLVPLAHWFRALAPAAA